MIREEEAASDHEGKREPLQTSKRVSDHLANERTFLAWIRTGLATISFGFVIERFGLALRQLGLEPHTSWPIPIPFSACVGIALTLLGSGIIIVALLNFLHNRTAIDAETFRPTVRFVILLTALSALVGASLAVYLVIIA